MNPYCLSLTCSTCSVFLDSVPWGLHPLTGCQVEVCTLMILGAPELICIELIFLPWHLPPPNMFG